jgi:hypothetical protein
MREPQDHKFALTIMQVAQKQAGTALCIIAKCAARKLIITSFIYSSNATNMKI